MHNDQAWEAREGSPAKQIFWSSAAAGYRPVRMPRGRARVSVRVRGATGLSWLRFVPKFADERVEGGREKQTKAGHAQHAKEHGRAQ